MNKRTFGKRTLAIFAAASLVLTMAASVLADAANPDSSVSASVNGLTVTVSGTWVWTRDCDSGTLQGSRDVGAAVDWNDPDALGNEVVTGLEVGTPTDNLVHLRDAAGQGDCTGTTTSAGAWGPISHTYLHAGQYQICAVMYDVDIDGAPPTTGDHSTQAGGTGHNDDNSAEANAFKDGVQCVAATIVVVEPSVAPASVAPASVAPSAEGSVKAAAGTPAASQADTALAGLGSNPLPTIAFSLILIASLSTLAYANVKTVRNRR